MKNFNKIDDFFEFISEAGGAVLALCGDPWFKETGGGTGSFLDFFCRQKENMIAIAAAGEGISREDCRANINPAELSAKVAEILCSDSIRDFFGLSAPQAQAPDGSSAQCCSAARDCTDRE